MYICYTSLPTLMNIVINVYLENIPNRNIISLKIMVRCMPVRKGGRGNSTNTKSPPKI